MIIKLCEHAQKVIGKKELVVITEQVDDVALLLGQMIKMGLPEVIDNHIPKHWKQRDLSWGWTAVIWLAYILTEGDHRKVSVEKYIEGMKNTISKVTGQGIDPLDFSDDRLAHLLKNLSKKKYWVKIEEELNERTIEVYELPTETVRCDTTTVSGHHEDTEDGILKFGHSKDDPTLPQIKIMIGALDPHGMPLATDVVSGEKADDGLYIPAIDRIHESIQKTNVIVVGDCKMSAFEIRAHIVGQKNDYLLPLPLTGNTNNDMESWINEGIRKDEDGSIKLIFKEDDKGEPVLVAGGYEFERKHLAMEGEQKIEWIERVIIVNSPTHAKQQEEGLEKRLKNAEEKIAKLTPERGRGKRQITEESILTQAIEKILKEHKVTDLLIAEYKKDVEQQIKYVGKGRGSKDRKTQVKDRVRYEITSVVRQTSKIADIKKKFGWRAFVTSAAKERLSLEDAVLSYRNEYRVERIFNRLKSDLNIAPLFVKRKEQIIGLTHLLSLGIRVLTMVEFVVRRSLRKDGAAIAGMHPENRRKKTAQPTSKRILISFTKIFLTIIKDATGAIIGRHLTPLSALQEELLQRLGFDNDLYQQLEKS